MSTVQITLALAILAALEYALWRTIKRMKHAPLTPEQYADGTMDDYLHGDSVDAEAVRLAYETYFPMTGCGSIIEPRRAK